MNEPTGIKRAINAAWDQLPHILISAIVAIGIFVGGLWLGHRDLRSVVDGVISDQTAPRLCARIGECPFCERIASVITEARISISSAEQHINSHNQEAEQWKQRIIRLEQQFYEISTRSNARPDPFIGTEGRDLRRRLDALESLEYGNNK